MTLYWEQIGGRSTSAEIVPTSYLLHYKCWSDGLTDFPIIIALSWINQCNTNCRYCLFFIPCPYSVINELCSIMCQGVGTRSTLQWHHKWPSLEISTQSSHNGRRSLFSLFNICFLFQLCRDAMPCQEMKCLVKLQHMTKNFCFFFYSLFT